jgi:hypothetical protein
MAIFLLEPLSWEQSKTYFETRLSGESEPLVEHQHLWAEWFGQNKNPFESTVILSPVLEITIVIKVKRTKDMR